ncbi:MAG: glycoside hydrolase family 28 protein [Clostridia bacterium]|nr:glycoside hydrolase family 28 protein [Clostridia bacterium]
MKELCITSRSCSVLLDPEGRYQAGEKRDLFLNGEAWGTEYRSVTSLFDLEPDTEYTLESRTEEGKTESLSFRTRKELCTLDVRDFGAKGDGETDDTAMLQAAILCCPEGGRVLIPPGTYATGPLFLKSHMTLEIADGATLALLTDRKRFPVLPEIIPADNPEGEVLMGLWEGDSEEGFASALTAIDVTDTAVIGEGVIDGRGGEGDWWVEPRVKRIARRGNLLYTQRCRNLLFQGLTFLNSPSWNLHPAYSEKLDFIDLQIRAPWDSPNTDGFDPESCRDVRLLGTEISVGDDCIALKSGKIRLGKKYHRACENVEIAWCAMLDGHGGVTLGSEMAGGIRNVKVHHCYMRGNDRGLRVKTRRGRGKDGVIDDILFEKVQMDGVKMPLIVNSMYFCDPDGHSEWVQSREKKPVDETTPRIGTVRFEQVEAVNCKACAGYVLGLPEQPMEHIALKDCFFSFDPEAEALVPVMAEQVEPCRRRGMILKNVRKVTLDHVRYEGVDGDWIDAENTEEITEQ